MTEIERVIADFISKYMRIELESKDASLAYSLTSIQQFELLLYVESEFGPALPHSIFADANQITVSHLAKQVAARLQPSSGGPA